MKHIWYHTLLILLSLFLLGCKSQKPIDTNKPNAESQLIGLFKPGSENYPIISAHRGGSGLLNYPENCLETINYLNDSISPVFEIDVAQTSDGKLILMHDKTLDRTTTGNGPVEQSTYADIQNLYLLDDFNNKTQYKIPLLGEVLVWAKENNAILFLDLKGSVTQKSIIEAIESNKAKDNCILITYDALQAKSAFKMAPYLMISVSARNMDEYKRLVNTKIPAKNMLGFTGTRLSDNQLLKTLEEAGIVRMLGTMGNLDRKAEAKGDSFYIEWLRNGIDMISTDRPFEAYNVIQNNIN